MKKTAFCLTFILITGAAYTGVTQTYGGNNSEFFIPQNAMVQRVEKLPPINVPQRGLPSAVRANTANMQNQTKAQNAAKTQPRQKIIRYQAIDGRFVPIYAPAEETVPTEVQPQNTAGIKGGNVTFEPDKNDTEVETIAANSVFAEPEADSNTAPADVTKNPAATPKTTTTVKAPNAVVQSGLPDYRNRYAQYLADLKVFNQTKDFPQNEELNASLNKMDSNREVLIYKK